MIENKILLYNFLFPTCHIVTPVQNKKHKVMAAREVVVG